MKTKTNAERTHYDVIGVPPAATFDQIHEAYLRLAKQMHPDAGGDEDEFKNLNAAWQVLKVKAARRLYDTILKLDGRNCKVCEGRGIKYSFKAKGDAPCPRCNGSGRLKI